MSVTLTTGTWASLSEHCPLRCVVEGSDFAVVTIGDDDQNIELLINAAGMRKLAVASVGAVVEIPRSTFLRAKFTVDGDVHVMFGDPNDEVNVVFERTALTRLVEVACELLAVPLPTSRTPPVELSGDGDRVHQRVRR